MGIDTNTLKKHIKEPVSTDRMHCMYRTHEGWLQLFLCAALVFDMI